MKLNQTLVVVAGLAAALQIATAGNVTGKITLKGTPPPEAPIPQAKENADCGKLLTAVPTTQHWVVSSKGELANVVVVIKGVAGAKSTGDAAAPALMDQVGCIYTPTILAVQTGQKITVKNSDPVMHNVHTRPNVAGNDEMNKAQFAKGPDLTFAFSKPEDFLKFQCDVHSWMFSWVTVVDHPYFAVTDKDGNFTIKDVPPGKYKIGATHRKAAPKGMESDIEVKADGGKADFTLEVPAK